MRISTSQMQLDAINSLLDRQSELNKTQVQVATGRRVLTPADDPVASANTLSLNQTKEMTSRYLTNAQAAEARLNIEEGVLIGVGDSLHRLREIAIQGNNDANTNNDRKFLAAEVRQIIDELLGLANTKDQNDDYLFSGYSGSTKPFAQNAAGGFDYYGDEGQRLIQIGPSRQVADSDSGTDVFRAIKNGNGIFQTQDNPANTGTGIMDAGSVTGSFVPDTYTITFTQALPTDPITYEVTGAVSGVVIPAGTLYQEDTEINFNGISTSFKGTPADGDSFTISPSDNQDIFTTALNLANALESDPSNNADLAEFHNAMNRVIVDIDQAQENVLDIRTSIGARLNAISSQSDNNEDLILQVEETLSIINDLDYAEAVSRLNLQLTGLEAAQKAFTRVQGLSLFNFI